MRFIAMIIAPSLTSFPMISSISGLSFLASAEILIRSSVIASRRNGLLLIKSSVTFPIEFMVDYIILTQNYKLYINLTLRWLNNFLEKKWVQRVEQVQEFKGFKSSGLDTPPASALDLLLYLGSWPLVRRGGSGRYSGCIEGIRSIWLLRPACCSFN